MASPRPFRTPSHVSCHPGSSSYGPSGCVRMASPRPCWHTPHALRAPQGTSPMAPVGASTWHPRAHFGTSLTRFVPPRDLHIWPQRVRAHGAPASISVHPSHVSSHPGSSTNGPSGCVHSVPAPISAHPTHVSRPPGSFTCGSIGCVHIGSPHPCRHTPHTSRAPPQGAPHMAPTGASTWRPRAHVGTPLRFRAPQGASPMAPTGASIWRPRAHLGTPPQVSRPSRELQGTT